MYRAHFASLLPFRFRDWSDYIATNEVFGTGAGVVTQFQLTMTYDPAQILLGSPGSLLYVRNITLPNASPIIKVAGVTKTAGVDYNISASGLVTFTSAPTGSLTWTGTFDVPVRFDGPLNVIMNESDIILIGSLPIKEVIGES
jgi:uncharacterized protein (TIGR02217 family)